MFTFINFYFIKFSIKEKGNQKFHFKKQINSNGQCRKYFTPFWGKKLLHKGKIFHAKKHHKNRKV